MKKFLISVFVLLVVFSCAVPTFAAPAQPGDGALIPVTPTFPSDKVYLANRTGINPDNLYENNNHVYLSKNEAGRIAEDLLNTNFVNTSILPVFEASSSTDGFVAVVSMLVSGKNLLAKKPNEINLIGMVSVSTGKLFEYVNSSANFGDKKFTLRSGGEIYNGEIDPNVDYELVAFIKDGGEFDLDKIVNGKVISIIFLASKESIIDDDCKFGCNASYGFFALALLGVLPFVLKKGK